MNRKAKEVLEGILARFETGEIPEVMALSYFSLAPVPSARWSLMNRMIMWLSGTTDARGIRQWNKVGRRVKKGAKAIWILVPLLVDPEEEKKEEGDSLEDPSDPEGKGEEGGEIEEIVEPPLKATEEGKKTKKALRGFIGAPVFRVEDTEGKPLDYEEVGNKIIRLPLIEVAEKWGVAVKGIPRNSLFNAYYDPQQREIALASEEETLFFHELSHVAYERLKGGIKIGQDWKQEVVAELSAAVLCQLTGRSTQFLGNSYQYISNYAREAGVTPVQGCLAVVKDVERVLDLILADARVEEGTQAEKVA